MRISDWSSDVCSSDLITMSQFFIDRPIFAWVLAILVMLGGLLSLLSLPIAQFPALAPPSVAIIATYPGADAETLENTTTQVIEQQMKGIDHLRYMSSTSDSLGRADRKSTRLNSSH